MFFKSKPNVSDTEKARIEFRLQQIAECIGFDRFGLPVLSRSELLGWLAAHQTPEQLIRCIGEHLGHYATDIRVEIVPGQTASCGSGGG